MSASNQKGRTLCLPFHPDHTLNGCNQILTSEKFKYDRENRAFGVA
jgi:hypothetical protein